jgi:acyl-homoserine-lactone acylase
MLSRSAVRMLPFLLTLIAAGAPADVTILRDRYGVPHIYGDSEADAAYGLGIAQCEDNVANLLYGLHAAVGRLAEFYGPQHLEQDIEARTLGNAWYAERDWPKLDVRVRRIVQAYCDTAMNCHSPPRPSRPCISWRETGSSDCFRP